MALYDDDRARENRDDDLAIEVDLTGDGGIQAQPDQGQRLRGGKRSPGPQALQARKGFQPARQGLPRGGQEQVAGRLGLSERHVTQSATSSKETAGFKPAQCCARRRELRARREARPA